MVVYQTKDGLRWTKEDDGRYQIDGWTVAGHIWSATMRAAGYVEPDPDRDRAGRAVEIIQHGAWREADGATQFLMSEYKLIRSEEQAKARNRMVKVLQWANDQPLKPIPEQLMDKWDELTPSGS